MSNPSGDSLLELRAASNAEDAAKDVWTKAYNAAAEARKVEESAREMLRKAASRRSMAFARVSAANRIPIRVLQLAAAPVVTRDPAQLQEDNRMAVRTAAYLALRRAAVPILALQLGPLVGIPARAVRNYLDGDPRFVIDHVSHGPRDAVRVSLAV